MTIEYTVNSNACNIKCKYCYQDAMRDAGAVNVAGDWERAKQALLRENFRFTVFGGEPLLSPIEHLDEVFKFGYESFKERARLAGQTANGIQTNGTLITDAHIEMFKKYDVSVGFSVDGPGALNDARAKGSQTRALTKKSIDNMFKCRQAGIQCGVIVTLHRINATKERLPELIKWFDWLDQIGFNGAGLHLLEVDNEAVRRELRLTDEENIYALKEIWRASRKMKRLKFSLFEDLLKLVKGEDHSTIQNSPKNSGVSCIWNSCDPQNTRAVVGVGPDGSATNCGRTNKSGINYIKADTKGLERYLILGRTPQSYGGCKDCRFFILCKGNCPGTAIDGDWRNRTEYCRVWYAMFEEAESIVLAERRLPLTRDKANMEKAYKVLEAYWRKGHFISINMALNAPTDAQGNLIVVNSHDDTHDDSHDDTPHSDIHCDSDLHSPDAGVEATWL